MERWRDNPEMRLTVVLLTAGGSLIAAGTAGFAASVTLAIGFVVVGALARGLAAVAAETALDRYDRNQFYADLWLGPMLAAAVVVLWTHATPGEVQALGGVVGLLGMANYFLRPVYHLLYGIFVRLSRL